jgi:hypothetical protein
MPVADAPLSSRAVMTSSPEQPAVYEVLTLPDVVVSGLSKAAVSHWEDSVIVVSSPV